MSLTRKLIVAHDHTYNNGESFPLTNMGSGGALEGQVPVANGTGGITWGNTNGNVEEGPGIDIINNNVVGLGLDSILLIHSNGDPSNEYASITAALAEATTGDVVWIARAGIFEETITLPPGVSLIGVDRKNCKISGTVNLGWGSLLSNLTVDRPTVGGGPYYGVIGPQFEEGISSSARIMLCDVTMNMSVVNGHAALMVGIAIAGEDVEIDRCHVDVVDQSGLATAYGVRVDGGANQNSETGTWNSWEIGASVQTTYGSGTGYSVGTPEVPITQEGDISNNCYIHAGAQGTAGVIYDLQTEYDLTSLVINWRRTGESMCDLSRDGVNWQEISFNRAAGPGSWDENSFIGENVELIPWRYIRFHENYFEVLGQDMWVGHFHLIGTKYVYKGNATIHHSVIYGTSLDLDASLAPNQIEVFSVQYNQTKTNGLIVFQDGDRGYSHNHDQYQGAISIIDTSTIDMTLSAEDELSAEIISGEATDGQVLVANGIGGVEWRDAGGSGSLSLMRGDGSPIEVFNTIVDGLNASVSGDILWITKSGTYTGDISIPSGVSLVGLSRNDVIIDGMITLNNDSYLENLSIIRSLNTTNREYGVTGSSNGIATLHNCAISVTQTGTGNAYGLRVMGGNLETIGCVLFGTTAGVTWGGIGQWQSRHDTVLSSIKMIEGSSPIPTSTFDNDLEDWVVDTTSGLVTEPSRYTYNFDGTEGHSAAGSLHMNEAGGSSSGNNAFLYKEVSNVIAHEGDTVSVWSKIVTGSYAEGLIIKVHYNDTTIRSLEYSDNSEWSQNILTIPLEDEGKIVTKISIGFESGGWEGFSESDFWYDDISFTLEISYPINVVTDSIESHDPITVIDTSTINLTLNNQELSANIISGAATDGQVLTADGVGGVAWEVPTQSLSVQEIDGTPSISNVNTINVTNGTLTDNGNGNITIDFGSATTDGSAIHDNVAGEINAITEKITPVDADLLLIEDSADSYNKKKVQISNISSGGGYTEGARVYHNVNQSINSSIWTTLVFNSERYDTDGIHDNVTNNMRLTCQTAGKYLIIANIEWDYTKGGSTRYCRILLNNTTIIANVTIGTTGADERMIITTIYELNQNDYVECQVYQDSGGIVDVVMVASFSPDFMMQRIG